MHIYISHDVDHRTIKEHLTSLTLPKYIGLSTVEFMKGLISAKTYFAKLSALKKNDAWDNLNRLLAFNKKKEIKATVFIATSNGRDGLHYSFKEAKKAIQKTLQQGFTIGVHGIEADNYEKMKKEYARMSRLTKKPFGIRMHYFKKDKGTLEKLKKIGYIYDASTYNPSAKSHKEKEFTRYPVNLMETYLFSPLKQGRTLKQAKEQTIKRLQELEETTGEAHILFHQRNFNKEQFPHHHEWYVWLINHCKKQGYSFKTYT